MPSWRSQNYSNNGPVTKYVLSCMAATVAETVTFPLDLTKTRLQIQGSSAAMGKQRGFLATGIGIVSEEGFLGLWRGVTPAVLRHYLYTGIRVGVYEQLRESIFKRNPDGSFPVYKAMFSGALGGAIAQLAASPMDLVKVQMQMEGQRRLLGYSPRVHGVYDCLSTTVRVSGITGLWKGWVPNCQRAALVNMADLAAYDTSKRTILKYTSLPDNYMTHALASLFSGLCACTASTPADVVKTRIMNNPELYRGSVDCFLQTIRLEGAFALYKGFVPIYIRMAPWSLTFWVTYEEIRRVCGSSSF